MTARQRNHLLLFPGLLLLAAMPNTAQGQGSGANVGSQLFLRNCAGCHGIDGCGGDKGPAIATMPSVLALSHDDLVAIVRDGEQAGMPAFPQLGDAGIRDVVDYLRILQGKTSSHAPATALVGNPGSGHTLFFGKAQCSSCHMVSGAGGFIAADLTSYGESHNQAAILQAIVNPDNPLVIAERVVEVRTRSGHKLIGVVRSEDNFTLELQTQDGRYHFLERNSLADVQYTNHSLMPHDYGTRLTPSERDDIASYLIMIGNFSPQVPTTHE